MGPLTAPNARATAAAVDTALRELSPFRDLDNGRGMVKANGRGGSNNAFPCLGGLGIDSTSDFDSSRGIDNRKGGGGA